MNIAILTIGDEICIGQIVNTNAAWIADQCSRAGFRVVAHSAVGDATGGILSEFDRLLNMADVLLITGGLGPTHDDRTKAALVEFLGDTLVQHEPTLVHIQELMRRRGRELNARTAAQAMQPSRSEPLLNELGTAPGMWFVIQHNGQERIIAAMPGVPAEMKHIMSERILPRLRLLHEQSGSPEKFYTLYTTLLTTGIAESTLADLVSKADELDEFLEGQELAFLPSATGVKLRLTATAHSRAEAEKILQRLEAKLQSRIERYIYGRDGDTLELLVGQFLKAQAKTLAVAESCTGGLLGATLTNIAGSSAYFLGGVQCYSNEAKVRFVGVQPTTIEQCGAVSQETALELASGIRERFGASFGVSITGVAGPDGGSTEKPVGTVWIGLADEHSCRAEKFIFSNERTMNRERAVAAALAMLMSALRS
jgi:nicotinamide-nucleotide amidase